LGAFPNLCWTAGYSGAKSGGEKAVRVEGDKLRGEKVKKGYKTAHDVRGMGKWMLRERYRKQIQQKREGGKISNQKEGGTSSGKNQQ